MSKIILSILLLLFFFPGISQASHICSEDIYDRSRQYLSTTGCNPTDCQEDTQTSGGRSAIKQAVCWPPNPQGGICSWDMGPPLLVKENKCKTGYVPAQEGNPFAPQCVCKSVGSSNAMPGSLGGATEDANCKTNINIATLRFCKNYGKRDTLKKSPLRTCTDPQNKPGSKCEKDDQIFCINTDGARDPNQIVCIPAPSTAASGEPCDEGGSRGPGISTAIGCIHTNPAEFVKDFMAFAIGIGGGLAFLMMLLGAFQMLTSAGNPDTLKAGQDRLTSAVIGLLFVIFAVLLLQIIGFGILKIPGFNP